MARGGKCVQSLYLTNFKLCLQFARLCKQAMILNLLRSKFNLLNCKPSVSYSPPASGPSFASSLRVVCQDITIISLGGSTSVQLDLFKQATQKSLNAGALSRSLAAPPPGQPYLVWGKGAFAAREHAPVYIAC